MSATIAAAEWRPLRGARFFAAFGPMLIAMYCWRLKPGTEPPMANDFAQVEAATRQLEQALLQVRHVTETLVLTAKLLLAVGALVTLVLQPNPGTATATAAAIADVVKTIRDQAR